MMICLRNIVPFIVVFQLILLIHFKGNIYTVKPVQMVTSIKQAPALKGNNFLVL